MAGEQSGRRRLMAALCLALAVVGCGDDDERLTGQAGRGAELFGKSVLGSNPGCVTCHSLDPGVTLIGPSLGDVAERAAERVPGVSAADYLRASIVDPDAFVVEGFAGSSMPGNWSSMLTTAEIDALVAYLLTRDG